MRIAIYRWISVATALLMAAPVLNAQEVSQPKDGQSKNLPDEVIIDENDSGDTVSGTSYSIGCDSFTSGCDSMGCGASACGGGPTRLFPQCGPIKLRGWLNAGIIANTASPSGRFNGPYNAVDRSNEAMFNQGYLIAESELPTCGSGIGGRVDFLYGEDYLLAESVGFERRQDGRPHWNGNQYYGVAIPQAYVELGRRDLSVKLGHFYSIVGYESLMAPENFFYSKSYSYQFAGPFTHWGALGTWKPSCNMQWQLGLINGWDALDRTTDQLGVLVGAKYTGKDWWSSFAVVTGDEPNNLAALPGVPARFTNRTRYSWLAGLQVDKCTEYVFHHWYGFQDGALAGGGDADWWGIEQYLYYTLSDKCRAAFRFEWFKDQDGTRIGLNRPSNLANPPYRGDLYSVSTGVNYQHSANVMVRPEVRLDYFDSDTPGVRLFDGGTDDYQLMFGIDAIVQF